LRSGALRQTRHIRTEAFLIILAAARPSASASWSHHQ
jgi:hypothetical protein